MKKIFILLKILCSGVILFAGLSASALPPEEFREKILIGIDPQKQPVYTIHCLTNKINKTPDMCQFTKDYKKMIHNCIVNIDLGQSLLQKAKSQKWTLGALKEKILDLKNETLKKGEKIPGQCFIFSTLVEDLLCEYGIENYLLAVSDDHIVNLYKSNDQWYVIDAMVDVQDPDCKYRKALLVKRPNFAIPLKQYKKEVQKALRYDYPIQFGVSISKNEDIFGISSYLPMDAFFIYM